MLVGVFASCARSSKSSAPKLSPHYLLEGTFESTSGIWDYYDIGNDEYAVSLNDSVKTSRSQAVEVPSVHPLYPEKKVTGIWHNAFHCTPATSITLTTNIKVIDFEAFLYSGITSINIPYSVTTIGDGAFYACSNLTKVTFVNSSEASTGTATQCGCEEGCVQDDGWNEVQSVTTGTSVPTGDLGYDYYIKTDSNALYAFNSDETTWEELTGTVFAISAPTTPGLYVNINNYKLYQKIVYYSNLTKIPSLCFFKCDSLAELSLPSSIVEICEEAFNGCSNLSSSLFFQNIEIIRSRAFQGCVSLSNIYISKSLFANASNVGIEPHAFNYCDPDLTFKFCGTSQKVTAWVTAHPNWGWRVDRGNPATAGNSYHYDLTTGDNFFTADWTYTVDGSNNVTITKFNGSASDVGDFISIPDHMPEPAGNKVIYIERNAFDDDVKAKLKRIYLPTTLMSVANWMFNRSVKDNGGRIPGYPNLYVIDDNTACSTDYNSNEADIKGRIDLSGLVDLEFIGIRAFANIGSNSDPLHNGKKMRDRITKLHLPARLRAIGGEAFGVFQKRLLPEVTDFQWEYDDVNSRLETVGTDAFYGLGISTGDGTQITGNTNLHREHSVRTIIFPRTFKYFGMLDGDIAAYKSQATNKFWFDEASHKDDKPEKEARPAHAFAGCSLLGKVIFKGSMDPSQTNDLVIPLQTFVWNESLQTIIFEERNGYHITFHTQQGATKNNDYGQEAIGASAGRGKNDFRGEPAIQTIVLPNQYTTLRIQDMAFHGNSRGVIYLSGTYGTNMVSDNCNGHWKDQQFEDLPLNEKSLQWKTIGDESFYNDGATHNDGKKYYGYCFAPAAKTQNSDASLNTFSINQDMPVYDSVHFVDEETGAEVGDNTCARTYVLQDKCSFVCEQDGDDYVATMTNYMYNLYDGSTNSELETARIPETVTYNGQDYTVTKIGDSAFSACFCDGVDRNQAVGDFSDLTTVEMPNTITSIGEYAFIRAYGITTIKSYSEDVDDGEATEGMPTSLEHIGKNAFLFSGVQQILNIPYECKFYENENETFKITSVFANSVSLRRITFRGSNDAANQTSSKYYETTTYTSAVGSETRTCALYSKDYTDQAFNGETLYNGNKLLLVLNRSANDYKKDSPDAEVNTGSNGLKFNGLYKTGPFLFGAYKMGLWIKELTVGNPTVDGSGNTYVQPLFSPIGNRTANATTGELTVAYMYLGENGILYDRDALKCELSAISGTGLLSMPGYAFNGCEEINDVELPNVSNGEVPVGLFANVAKTTTNYKTTDPSATEGSTARVLDLRGTGYKKLNKDCFKNNKSLTKFIAPNVANFTIDTSAFEGCSNLATLDFSNVTNSLTINGAAFKSTKTTTITWPSCQVTISDGSNGSGAFASCSSLTSLTLPASLKKLGSYAFQSCGNLATVTADGNLTNITTIGTGAFMSCSKLDSFDFDKFTALTTINGSAFKSAGKLSATGEITLPTTLTSIGQDGFASSKITIVNIRSSEISFGQTAFSSCTSLVAVRFTNHSCNWKTYNSGVFNGCTSLVELQLPSTFRENNTNYNNSNTYFIQNDSSVNFYFYKKYSSSVPGVTEGWRKYGSGLTRDIYYYMESVQDFVDGGVVDANGVVDGKGTIHFWTFIGSSNVAIELGTVTAYNNGTITFSSGYTLTGNVFTAP